MSKIYHFLYVLLFVSISSLVMAKSQAPVNQYETTRNPNFKDNTALDTKNNNNEDRYSDRTKLKYSEGGSYSRSKPGSRPNGGGYSSGGGHRNNR